MRPVCRWRPGRVRSAPGRRRSRNGGSGASFDTPLLVGRWWGASFVACRRYRRGAGARAGCDAEVGELVGLPALDADADLAGGVGGAGDRGNLLAVDPRRDVVPVECHRQRDPVVESGRANGSARQGRLGTAGAVVLVEPPAAGVADA